jgi:hypothetical protein
MKTSNYSFETLTFILAPGLFSGCLLEAERPFPARLRKTTAAREVKKRRRPSTGAEQKQRAQAPQTSERSLLMQEQ